MTEIIKKLGGNKYCGVSLVDLDRELGEGSRERLWEAVRNGEIRYSQMINGIGFWVV